MKKIALIIVGILVVGAIILNIQRNQKAAKVSQTNETSSKISSKENLLKLGIGETHYKCPNECENSGGEGAGTCPTCGTAYVHNQAFHGDNGNSLGLNDTPLPILDPTSGASTESAQATLNTTTTTSNSTTSTNNSGVFHYTCKQGHGGTNVKDQTCGQCGKPYEHNPDYHSSSTSTTPSSPQITTSTSSPSITASPPPSPTSPTITPTSSGASGGLHYTCPKGDGGGSSNRGDKCGKCGGELAHNEAYHN